MGIGLFFVGLQDAREKVGTLRLASVGIIGIFSLYGGQELDETLSGVAEEAPEVRPPSARLVFRRRCRRLGIFAGRHHSGARTPGERLLTAVEAETAFGVDCRRGGRYFGSFFFLVRDETFLDEVIERGSFNAGHCRRSVVVFILGDFIPGEFFGHRQESFGVDGRRWLRLGLFL